MNANQQEWTPYTVFTIMGTDYGADGWKRETLVADAHNAEVKLLVDALKHLMQSNHGFKPEFCSACSDADALAKVKQ